MKRISFLQLNPLPMVLLTAVMITSGGAFATDRKVNESDHEARVVAHLSLDGLSAVDMTMQKKGDDKYYLYVQHPKDQGISIIDISKPAQPKAIGLIPWPRAAMSSSMSMTGDLAIIAGNPVLAGQSNTSEDHLVLWDLSNPAAPRVVQEFFGVVKWLQDERNLIYVLNGDGLWVVSEPVDRRSGQTEPSVRYGD